MHKLKKLAGLVMKTPAVLMGSNFYAKILGGANFLQNTTIEGNKATYQTGYIVAGSLGYCWRVMACVWKLNMLLEEML